MSFVLVVFVAAAMEAAEPAAPAARLPSGVAAADSPGATPRSGQALRTAVRQALKRWARPTDKEAQEAAREFISLYIEIQRDKELATSQREYLRMKVRRRLMDLHDQIARWVAIQRRLAREKARKRARRSESTSDSSASQTGGDQTYLEQGPARGGGAMAPADYGQLLVDLIRTTVQPASWDVNGGPGTIFYWYPGRALVVRQTGEVHGEVGTVLGQLRRLQN